MRFLQNDQFEIQMNEQGQLQSIRLKNDRKQMNWLIEQSYLEQSGYQDYDKLFGLFDLRVNGVTYVAHDAKLEIVEHADELQVVYHFDHFDLVYGYSTKDSTNLIWTIFVVNHSIQSISIQQFQVWFSVAYVMFRDIDVHRNIDHSCAMFPSISEDYSKFALIRRSNQAPHLGVYQLEGNTLSLGSYCTYTNNFDKQPSPSLDGMIFHALVLASEQFSNPKSDNWLYEHQPSGIVDIAPGQSALWQYAFSSIEDEREFHQKGYDWGHPKFNYSPSVIQGNRFEGKITIPRDQELCTLSMEWMKDGQLERVDVTSEVQWTSKDTASISISLYDPGEHKFICEMDSGKRDFVICNVLEPISEMLQARIEHLTEHAYIHDQDDKHAFAFRPVSNQGESLGKLAFILMNSIVGTKNLAHVQMVEKSAYLNMRTRWFIDGDISRPYYLYGSFYRLYDYDYIAYIFYLLSRFNDSELIYQDSASYLKLAYDVLIHRLDPELHTGEREKREALMVGYNHHYIDDLFVSLIKHGRYEEHANLQSKWNVYAARLKTHSNTYQDAITEHYFDNAGFGTVAESLSSMGNVEEAKRYGELILANIGFSNDFRAQNPDRWWEALAYMTHSLWGGVVANSALTLYQHTYDVRYLKAAYRSMMAVFYCYDWHATATEKKLKRGEATSTYCVTNPNLNKLQISQNRFGQSVFLEDEQFFAGNATGDDWDMGLELVAYLSGFGQHTYIYYEDGQQLTCVNGSIDRDGEDYFIRSFAPYPKAYHFYEEQLSVEGANGQLLSSVRLRRNSSHQYVFIT